MKMSERPSLLGPKGAWGGGAEAEGIMRLVIACFIVAAALAAPAAAAPAPSFDNADTVLRWINGYRAKPELARVADAVRTLSRADAFRETESSAVYVGFLAGIIGANPGSADDLITKTLSIKTEDQWVLVRAIAYSGAPGWKDMLYRFAGRMPTRRLMIDKYATHKLPTLDDIGYDKSPTTIDKFKKYSSSVGNFFTGRKPAEAVRLEATSEVLDTLWGYYFATGDYGPVARIVRMLPWSKDKSSTEKLTVGSMAKYTLASNAAHDHSLLDLLKREAGHAPDDAKPILAEITEAVDTMEIARIRKEALAAIDDLKRKGPGDKRDLSTWGQVGQGALALGCVAAAATGQVEIGVPCVVGGALSSAALNYWTKD
jgi:hypothetical protein